MHICGLDCSQTRPYITGFLVRCPFLFVENLFEERSLLILGYLSGISMCDHPEKNPCTYIKYCIDLEGVVSCACPEGMSALADPGLGPLGPWS